MNSRSEIMASQSALISAIYRKSNNLDSNAKGLAVYQRSLAANAVRALAISFPTVEKLLGKECFAHLTTDFINACPLSGGDWGEWGKEFPNWIAESSLAREYPYLQDCTQLDWLCHLCERAQDTSLDINSLALLTQIDPYEIELRYSHGVALIESPYPVVDIWNAHHRLSNQKLSTADLFSKAAKSIANNESQAALVWRPEWKAQVKTLTEAEQLWLRNTLQSQSLGAALDQMQGTGFSLQTWMPHAINSRLICGVGQRSNSSH